MIACKTIPEIVIPDKRLGRHIEHDERSRAFAVVPEPSVKIHTVRHPLYGSPLNQGSLGSCTGNAVVQALNTRPLHVTGVKLLREDDAIAVYSLATSIDEFTGEFPPTDTGSSGLAAAKAAQQKGLITEYRHAFDVIDAMQALMGRSVITGVPWYEGFDHPNPSGVVKVEGQVRGGHEFAVIGYEMNDRMVVAVNSWGIGWGVRGRFRFDLKDWERLLGEQGDVTVLIK